MTYISKRPFQRLARTAAAAAMLASLCALAGWLFHVPALTNLWPGLPQMKANTALAILLSSASLALQLRTSASHTGLVAARVAAAGAALLGLAALAETGFGVDLGIDQLLVADPWTDSAFAPGRMAPATAFGIASLGLGVALLGSHHAPRFSEALLVAGGIVGLAGIAGYLYEVRELRGIAQLYRPMAFLTALSLSLLSVGGLLAHPERGLVSILAERGPGGAAARVLVPAAIAVPLLLGWVRLMAERSGVLDHSSGLVVFAIATVLILASLVLWNSASLNRSDAWRRDAEAERTRVTEESTRRSALFRSVLDTIGDGVVASDRDGRFLIFNPAAEQILGSPASEAAPADWSLVYGLYREDGVTLFPAEDLPLSRAARGESTNEVVLMVRSPTRAHDAWIRVTGRPLRNASEAVCGGVIVFSEITATKLAEIQMSDLNRQLTRRTAELEMANSEMAAFSYSISHDLRAPLRAIDGFSQAVVQDCADQLDDVGKGHLNRVCAAAQRMGDLIDALLGLARISHGGLLIRGVDLAELAGEIAAELGASEPERSVDFKIDPGLEVVGDARLLRAALENLIGNAWKFTARREHAHIEVGAKRRGGETTYFVRDDGVGFDTRRAKHLFGAFQRMHSQSDFEGTGIGLATVSRIVTRHGGRIWAEAEVDRGATFWFTLAADERAGRRREEHLARRGQP